METGGGGLVLVCDDTEPIRRLIRVNLELDGYDVEEATDGQELLDRLRRPGAPLPGVVILDAQMEPRDGWWAISQIRSDPRLSDVPVLMVTASVQQHDRVQAEAAGLDAFVPKPFDPEYLVELVQGFMGDGRDGRTDALANSRDDALANSRIDARANRRNDARADSRNGARANRRNGARVDGRRYGRADGRADGPADAPAS